MHTQTLAVHTQVPTNVVMDCNYAQYIDRPWPTRIERLQNRYLSRKNYSPTNGVYIFAKHEPTNKAVALFNGKFNRDALRQVMAEAKTLGLGRITVLVNGLISYSGFSVTAIRVDNDTPDEFIDDDVKCDFMDDMRAAKNIIGNR